MEKQLEKIFFIEQNSSFFTDCSHQKLNDTDNVSTALLSILLSNNNLENCKNYDLLLEKIKEYIPRNTYCNFIEIISHLKFYVNRIYNYNDKGNLIIQKLDEIIEIYRKNSKIKIKKMA